MAPVPWTGTIACLLTFLESSASWLTLGPWPRDGQEGRGATSVPLLLVLPVLVHFWPFLNLFYPKTGKKEPKRSKMGSQNGQNQLSGDPRGTSGGEPPDPPRGEVPSPYP